MVILAPLLTGNTLLPSLAGQGFDAEVVPLESWCGGCWALPLGSWGEGGVVDTTPIVVIVIVVGGGGGAILHRP